MYSVDMALRETVGDKRAEKSVPDALNSVQPSKEVGPICHVKCEECHDPLDLRVQEREGSRLAGF